MKKIILIGGGGHFNSCVDVIRCQKKFSIYGFVDKKKQVSKKSGVRFLGGDSELIKIRDKVTNAHISIAQFRDLNTRANFFKKLKKFKFKLPKVISPNAYVSKTSKIGEGTIIMHGAIINSNAKIGNNCIINTGAIIEHDVKIEDHCNIAPGSIINGNVIIEKQSFVGSGTIIKQGIKIGAKSFINANLFIKSNLKKSSFKK